MSAPAFTPGPWRVYQHFATPTAERFDVVGASRDDDVAENATHANARLIAAAPDLYDALELADATLRGANMNRAVVERKVAEALSKARGEEVPA